MACSLQHQVLLSDKFSWMFPPKVNYTRENYGTATEKLAFECDKGFSGAVTNLHQQTFIVNIHVWQVES